MISKSVKTLGLKINVAVPETVEEYDTLAKKIGACLESAVANTIYRGVLAEFRSEFCDKLEATSGIARKTKESGKFEKGEDGKEDPTKPILVFAETEADYFDRVVVESKSKVEDFQALADEVAATLVFDPSASEKKPAGPKKTAQKYLEAAKAVEAAGKLEAVAAALAAKLNLVVAATIEGVGAAIAEDQRRKSVVNEYL